MSKLINKLSLIAGIFVTMPIVALKVGGMYISGFYISFAMLMLVLIINNGANFKIKLGHESKNIFLWIVFAVLSGVVGFIYFSFAESTNQEWSEAALNSIPKLMIFALFFIVWKNNPRIEDANHALVKGLLIGTIYNCLWAVIDAAGFYVTGVSIGNQFFMNYAVDHAIHFNMISISYGGLIRASGFNYDPAHIGFFAPLLLLYALHKRRHELTFLSVLAIIASSSTTALASSIIIVLFNLKTIRYFGRKDTIKGLKKVLYIVITVVLIAFVFLKFGTYIETAVDLFFNRVSSEHLSNVETNIRMIYWKYFPIAVLEESILAFIGSGYGTASYWYLKNEMVKQMLASHYFPYDPEMTHFSYFLDTGIIGMYFLWTFIVAFIKQTRKMMAVGRIEDYVIILHACVFTFIGSGMFYHYTINAPQMLAFIIGSTWLDDKDDSVFLN